MGDVHVQALTFGSSSKCVFECITRTPRYVEPYEVRWYKNDAEIVSRAYHSKYTLFNYCSDDQIDGSVVNYHKLIVAGPIDPLADQGTYRVRIDGNDDHGRLTSQARLVVDTTTGTIRPTSVVSLPVHIESSLLVADVTPKAVRTKKR